MRNKHDLLLTAAKAIYLLGIGSIVVAGVLVAFNLLRAA